MKPFFSLNPVFNRPDLIKPEFLEAFIKLWNCKILEFWTKPLGETDNEPLDHPDNIQSPLDPDNIQLICPTTARHIFSNLINHSQMHRLMNSSSNSFEALERLLVALIENRFLTISSLNEQFVSLLREEWPEVSLLFQNY